MKKHRDWVSMDINLIEHVHRKLQDHLNVLVYIVASCTDSEELSGMIQALYNGVLRIFQHYSSILEREEPNEVILCPSVERTGRPGRPRYREPGPYVVYTCYRLCKTNHVPFI